MDVGIVFSVAMRIATMKGLLVDGWRSRVYSPTSGLTEERKEERGGGRERELVEDGDENNIKGRKEGSQVCT